MSAHLGLHLPAFLEAWCGHVTSSHQWGVVECLYYFELRQLCLPSHYQLNTLDDTALGVDVKPQEGRWNLKKAGSWIPESSLGRRLLTDLDHPPWTVKWMKNKLLLHLSHYTLESICYISLAYSNKLSCQCIGVTTAWWVGKLRACLKKARITWQR